MPSPIWLPGHRCPRALGTLRSRPSVTFEPTCQSLLRDRVRCSYNSYAGIVPTNAAWNTKNIRNEVYRLLQEDSVVIKACSCHPIRHCAAPTSEKSRMTSVAHSTPIHVILPNLSGIALHAMPKSYAKSAEHSGAWQWHAAGRRAPQATSLVKSTDLILYINQFSSRRTRRCFRCC